MQLNQSEVNFTVFKDTVDLGVLGDKGCLFTPDTLRLLEALYVSKAKEKLQMLYPNEEVLVKSYEQATVELDACLHFINHLVSYHNLALGVMAGATGTTTEASVLSKANTLAQKEF